jgi:hypothetical protein
MCTGDSSVELEIAFHCFAMKILIIMCEMAFICIVFWFIHLSQQIFTDWPLHTRTVLGARILTDKDKSLVS